MSVALALVGIDQTRRNTRRTFSLTFSGNYTTGGDTINFTTATNPQNQPAALAFGSAPLVFSLSGSIDGYTVEMVPGSGLTNWKIKIFSASGTELSAGAYPAGISGDTNLQLTIVNPTNQ